MRRWWHDHSLTLVVAVLIAVLLGGAFWLHWGEWRELGRALSVALCGEMVAILAIVHFAKSLRERGSPESGDEE